MTRWPMTNIASALLLLQEVGDGRGMVGQLEELALVAVRLDQPLRSAALLAAAGVERTRMGLPVPAGDRSRLDAVVQELRSGDESHGAAWQAGATLSLGEAVSLALSSVIDPRRALPEPASDGGATTATDGIAPRLAPIRAAWLADLHDTLTTLMSADEVGALLDNYGPAFPTSYWTNFPAEAAAADVLAIERRHGHPTGAVDCSLRRGATSDSLDLRLYSSDRLAVADVLPVLENFGLRILDEHLYELRPARAPAIWIHDFGLTCADGGDRAR